MFTVLHRGCSSKFQRKDMKASLSKRSAATFPQIALKGKFLQAGAIQKAPLSYVATTSKEIEIGKSCTPTKTI